MYYINKSTRKQNNFFWKYKRTRICFWC
jgi:hypothetical protein